MANITCVKCWRVCAHRNMFNSFYDCREGCVRCVLYFLFFFFLRHSDVCSACVQTTRCLWRNVSPCWILTCLCLSRPCLDTVHEGVSMRTNTRPHIWVFFCFFFTINLLFVCFYVMLLMISVVFYSFHPLCVVIFEDVERIAYLQIVSPISRYSAVHFFVAILLFFKCSSPERRNVFSNQEKKKNRGKLEFRGFFWTFLTFNLMAFYLVNPRSLPLHFN